ncbi:hypothetical protein GTW37_04315 [Streptomyces sp. SID4931]|nr:hypothetical protein [Streptomyces sp. SID4931]
MISNNALTLPLRPERTFAFVAGVEQYTLSRGWNLHGPARDALRFAHWLTGPAQVPHENVRLLLSPLRPDELDWTVTTGLAALRDACRPATEENVKNALQVELPQCDGDLLWIFWAGHGFQTGKGRCCCLARTRTRGRSAISTSSRCCIGGAVTRSRETGSGSRPP